MAKKRRSRSTIERASILGEFRDDLMKVAKKLCRTCPIRSIEPDDLTQDTMLIAISNAHKLKEIRLAWPWLVAIMKQHLRTMIRTFVRYQRRVDALMVAEVSSPPPDAAVRDALERTLEVLRPVEKECFEMYFFTPRTQLEVAASLGIDRVEVASNLRRAERVVRDLLQGSTEALSRLRTARGLDPREPRPWELEGVHRRTWERRRAY